MHHLRPKLDLPEDFEIFVQAEPLVASDHRDLFAQSLGDDLAVERVNVVWLEAGGRKGRTHDAPCKAVCEGPGPQGRGACLQRKIVACREPF